jgi:hypothetical protein
VIIVRQFFRHAPCYIPDEAKRTFENLSERPANGPELRTNPIMAGQLLHVQSGGDASWTTLFSLLPMPLHRITRST